MNSKQITITYFASKINNLNMLFNDINIFMSILGWTRNSLRKFFDAHLIKVDDFVKLNCMKEQSEIYHSQLIL